MVIKVGLVTPYLRSEFLGLSTDTKPTKCDPSSTFHECDTGNNFIYGPTATEGVCQWWPIEGVI